MAHFGEFLRLLREARSMTQSDLAVSADISPSSIYRAEQEPKCTWRRTTASDVLSALQRRIPLTRTEEEQYIELTGIRQIVAAARAFASDAQGAQPISTDPRVHAAHHYLQRLIDERGVANILPALTGIAAAWDIDLPPMPTDDELSRGPRWTLVSAPRKVEDREVTVYTPVMPHSKDEKSKKSSGEGRERKGA